MSVEPAQRRVTQGFAGALDRQTPADRHSGSREDFLRRHEMEAKQAARGTRRERSEFSGCLLQRAGDTRNVFLAIEHCASRSHAAGPDGFRPTCLDHPARAALAQALAPLIQSGSHCPGEVRHIWISKGCGRGKRPIWVQNFADRVVERAILQAIRPLLQADYLDTSLGFRYPGRRREDALLMAEHLAASNERWTWISQDLRNAFENVPRGRLVQLLRKSLGTDSNDLFCIFVEQLIAKSDRRGIRQGGSLSPEMLNLYLHWMLDTWWQRRFPEASLLRVADDLLILSKPDEVGHLHDQLVIRTREIGMPLKFTKDTAIRNLSEGLSATWLGYQIQKVASGIQVEIADTSWDKLEEHLHLAHGEPIPPLSANETILGWIGQQGAAYRKDRVAETYTGIRRQASEMGFEEIPSQEEVASRWYRAYLRDWLERRESSSLPDGSVSTLADGCADQHCEIATTSRRGGVDSLSDCPPQQLRPRREVYLYCDGSCLFPSRVGGWAYLVVEPETGWRDVVAGGIRRATNNRMELTAVIRGLASLPDSAVVRLVVDSEYVQRGITEWLPGWKQQWWRAGRRRPRPLKNVDLWQQLDAQLQRHIVSCQWVRGHYGHAENEFVDRVAGEVARSTLNTEGGDLEGAV